MGKDMTPEGEKSEREGQGVEDRPMGAPTIKGQE